MLETQKCYIILQFPDNKFHEELKYQLPEKNKHADVPIIKRHVLTRCFVHSLHPFSPLLMSAANIWKHFPWRFHGQASLGIRQAILLSFMSFHFQLPSLIPHLVADLSSCLRERSMYSLSSSIPWRLQRSFFGRPSFPPPYASFKPSCFDLVPSPLLTSVHST